MSSQLSPIFWLKINSFFKQMDPPNVDEETKLHTDIKQSHEKKFKSYEDRDKLHERGSVAASSSNMCSTSRLQNDVIRHFSDDKIYMKRSSVQNFFHLDLKVQANSWSKSSWC